VLRDEVSGARVCRGVITGVPDQGGGEVEHVDVAASGGGDELGLDLNGFAPVSAIKIPRAMSNTAVPRGGTPGIR